MAIIITDECIACGVCVPECPNDAITEGDIYVIAPDLCTECHGFYDSPQCASVCPVDCCIPDDNHKETKEQLEAKAKKIHPDKTDFKF
ncbi:MAG: YfhL family 4Fe-4S dicluster ferredoxin [Candidatus Acididesulfobacter guangdongensis]|jgi:ferredoxin|uniref:YfhL family 4Fe-4S dicluster ferredoxin n=1 Tax=Acididesulfobacter guangdongensis TaxID=2597225 RepID=A0A519BG65_ACIG2|nr:MAG: YfhL family 4Fe-4S dicluster ferredoxin [Candidatus Acididesulfobacter guangdongensis]